MLGPQTPLVNATVCWMAAVNCLIVDFVIVDFQSKIKNHQSTMICHVAYSSPVLA
jgi:hypothetical protein